jgi:hypothetical protein
MRRGYAALVVQPCGSPPWRLAAAGVRNRGENELNHPGVGAHFPEGSMDHDQKTGRGDGAGNQPRAHAPRRNTRASGQRPPPSPPGSASECLDSDCARAPFLACSALASSAVSAPPPPPGRGCVRAHRRRARARAAAYRRAVRPRECKE